MRVSSQSNTLIRVVAPLCVGAALAAAAACAPPQEAFDEDIGNVVPTSGVPSATAPAASPTMSAMGPVPVGQPTFAQPTAGAPSASTPVGTPSSTVAAPPGATSAAPPVGQPSTPPVVTPTAPAPTMRPAGGTGAALDANEDFWVAATTNGVGVEGSWYGYADKTCGATGACKGDGKDTATAAGGTTVLMSYDAGAVCIKGNTTELVVGMEGDTWGAGFGFNFADGDAWDGSAYKGVSFTAAFTSGGAVQVQLEMDGIAAGQEHQVELKSGANSVKWADVEQPSWVETDGTPKAFNEGKLVAIKFKVESVAAADTYSVCISGLKIIE